MSFRVGIIPFLFALLPFVWGCGPSPEEVCDKMIDLTNQATGTNLGAKAIDRGTCVKDEERRKELQGMFKYKENNKCMMAAQSYEDLKKCAAAK